MTKSSINVQVDNILGMIIAEKFEADRLVSLLKNVAKNKQVTDEQSEDLVEAIEKQLWVTSAIKAKKIFGARNRSTCQQLQFFLDDIVTRHELSENQHKTKVKVGVNVLIGQALIYDYISYKNRKTGLIAHMAFRKIRKEDKLELDVRKVHFKEQHTEKGEKPIVFESHNFDDACALFENNLSEVLSGL